MTAKNVTKTVLLTLLMYRYANTKKLTDILANNLGKQSTTGYT